MRDFTPVGNKKKVRKFYLTEIIIWKNMDENERLTKKIILTVVKTTGNANIKERSQTLKTAFIMLLTVQKV